MTGFERGAVFRYPYLWRRKALNGEETGRKDRPVCLVIPVRIDLGTVLCFLPITTMPPAPDQIVVEIPESERQRAGLSENKRSWVVCSEYNLDILELSHNIAGDAKPLGRFSKRFLDRIVDAALPTLKGRAGRVARR